MPKIMIAFLILSDRLGGYVILYTAIPTEDWAKSGAGALSSDIAERLGFREETDEMIAAWEMPERIVVCGTNDEELPFVFGDPL